jgi:uncharacterized protein (UPF0333 family)
MRFTGQLARSRRRRSRGQALVEFAIVIPLFLVIFVAIAEFSFMFTSYISVGYASNDSAQMAAMLGNTAGADAAILERVNKDVGAPADRKLIKSVTIFWVNTASGNGSPVSGAETIYTYDGGSHPFAKADGTTIFLPFIQTANGYPEANRCNANMGLGCKSGHTTVDTIAVKIVYEYKWITPFPVLVGGSNTGPTLTSINMMRLEPVL